MTVSSRFKHLFIILLLLPVTSRANINLDKIADKVKGFIGAQLSKAYCMVKRDCHQRVIYVMNLSEEDIRLNGCHFAPNYVVPPGADAFTAQKNSKGHDCELSISKGDKTLTVVNLSPRENTINYKELEKTMCITGHRVLKSWKKCPWHCGRYRVHGYIGACAVL